MAEEQRPGNPHHQHATDETQYFDMHQGNPQRICAK